MRIGQLNKRITFRSELKTPDGYGGSTTSWPDLTTVWGSFKPERGYEKVEAGRLSETLAGVITIRSSSVTRQLTAGHIAVLNDEAYQIRSISNPDQRNRFLELAVERGGVAK